MFIRAYSLIINKTNRSLYIIWLLEGITNNSNKYCIFGLTFQSPNVQYLLLKYKMLLGVNNFNILGIHWKIRLLGGCSQKTNIEKSACLKRGGFGQFVDLRGKGLIKKEWGGDFEGERGWYPNSHYALYKHWQKLY